MQLVYQNFSPAILKPPVQPPTTCTKVAQKIHSLEAMLLINLGFEKLEGKHPHLIVTKMVLNFYTNNSQSQWLIIEGGHITNGFGFSCKRSQAATQNPSHLSYSQPHSHSQVQHFSPMPPHHPT
nr:hypothetical protein HmN_000207300 [Hymenolepis microstoma]